MGAVVTEIGGGKPSHSWLDEVVVDVCMACVVHLHHECYEPVPVDSDGEQLWQCCCVANPDPDAQGFIDTEAAGPGRPMAGIDEITNVLSTGRKRAAMMAVIFPGMLCDWAGLRYAGGGPHPIVGCRGNRIADVKKNADLPENADARGERHHGPNKNVLDNSVGVNLHRVCASCHSHWHALNDKFYDDRPADPAAPHYPREDVKSFKHDSDTMASEDDFALSEEWWGTRTEQRKTEYPFAPPS